MSDKQIAGLEERTARLEQIRTQTRKLSSELYELSLLNEISEAAHSIQSVQQLLDSVLTTCMQMLKADAGSVFLYDNAADELVLATAKGKMADSLQGVRQKLDEGVAGYVATALKPVFVADIESDGRFTPRESERYSGASFVSVPLHQENELLGVMSLHNKEGGKAFEPQDLKQLLIAANYSASAIRKLGRHELLEEFNDELHNRLDTALTRLDETSAELNRLKRYNESIVTSIPLGLLTFNRDFRITFINQRAREIFGLTPERGNLLDLDVTEQGRLWAKELPAVIELADVIRFDSAVLVPPDGDRTYIIRAIATPLKAPDGATVGGVVVVEDITQRVKMERMLAASERHAVIGKLAARVAHELNNPLDGILRFVNLCLTIARGDQRMQQYLGEARKGLERMAGIVGSLLEFSRNTHRLRRNVQINDAVKEAVNSIKFTAEERNVEIVTELADALPEAACDLTQVVLNLVKNAIDAMPGGGVLTIATGREADCVRLTVADTGTGIPPELRKRVFDPFFTTKESGKGTGLGLAICNDMVEKYQGTISLESEEGKGTTFIVKVPIA